MNTDILIYGGTAAAVVAAVQAKRLGKSVVIVCPDKHLGGLSSGGLGFTDTGKTETIGGIAREFFERIYAYYQQEDAWKWQPKETYDNKGQQIWGQKVAAMNHQEKAMWVFEPHVAEQIFDDFINEYEIPVYRDEWLVRPSGVEKKDKKIVALGTLSGKRFTAKVFIDASYEGDLMAEAGVSYHVGREANSIYEETWNGSQVAVYHHEHFFRNAIDPYRIPGDVQSGLLPRISDEKPAKRGEGDHRVQAYCFRMCLSKNPANRVPFPKPEGYDPYQYELLLRVLSKGRADYFEKFDPIPNAKTDTNNHGPFSTDNIGMNYDYPEGSYAKRKEIFEEHRTYQQGLMYFLANDPRSPNWLQSEIKQWGLPADEFVDNGHWSHQLYIREARRMIGSYVMTEHEVLARRSVTTSVGMGSYSLDSHNTLRYVSPEGFVQNEGDIHARPPKAYQIDYGSLIPKASDCSNLLVPVCVSSSHIAYGSIRMEPVFMILGHSAATAAAQAIDESCAIQNINLNTLRKKLEAQGQRLE